MCNKFQMYSFIKHGNICFVIVDNFSVTDTKILIHFAYNAKYSGILFKYAEIVKNGTTAPQNRIVEDDEKKADGSLPDSELQQPPNTATSAPVIDIDEESNITTNKEPKSEGNQVPDSMLDNPIISENVDMEVVEISDTESEDPDNRGASTSQLTPDSQRRNRSSSSTLRANLCPTEQMPSEYQDIYEVFLQLAELLATIPGIPASTEDEERKKRIAKPNLNKLKSATNLLQPGKNYKICSICFVNIKNTGLEFEVLLFKGKKRLMRKCYICGYKDNTVVCLNPVKQGKTIKLKLSRISNRRPVKVVKERRVRRI